MPVALVPDGFELKKVTKLQKDAVDKYYRHENVTALINNPEIIKQLIIVATGYLALKEAEDLYDFLAEKGVAIKEEVKRDYTKKRTVGAGAPVGVSIEQFVEEGLKRLGNLPFI